MFKFTILSIIILLHIPFITADIRNIKITSDSRPEISLEMFGFTESGHLSISIESATFTSIHNLSRLAFCIVSDDVNLRECPQEKNPTCPLDYDEIQILFNFTQLAPPKNSFQKSYPIKLPSMYSLYFVNCQPNSPITMHVTTEMYNLNNGGYKDYLPPGLTRLPVLYLVYATTYFVFLIVWIYISIANKKTHFGTHLLMGGLILTKALGLICSAADKWYVNHSGTSNGWDVVSCAFRSSAGILLCTIIAMIGINWSIMRPPTRQRTMMVILICSLLLKVIFDAVVTLILENRPFIKNWAGWYTALSYYHIVPYFVTEGVFQMAYISLFGMHYREIVGTTGRRLIKFNFFKFSLSLVLFVFVIFTMFGFTWKEGFLLYRLHWVGSVVEEITTLALYVLMFYVFRGSIQEDLYFVFNVVADVVVV